MITADAHLSKICNQRRRWKRRRETQFTFFFIFFLSEVIPLLIEVFGFLVFLFESEPKPSKGEDSIVFFLFSWMFTFSVIDEVFSDLRVVRRRSLERRRHTLRGPAWFREAPVEGEAAAAPAHWPERYRAGGRLIIRHLTFGHQFAKKEKNIYTLRSPRTVQQP